MAGDLRRETSLSVRAHRLRLVSAQDRPRPEWAPFEAIRVSARCIALGETRPASGAFAFACHLVRACAGAQRRLFVAVCEDPEDAGFASIELAQLSAVAPDLVRVSVQGEADLRELVRRAERDAPDASWLFLGELPVLGLVGAVKVVIDRPFAPGAARARAQRGCAHLLLSAPRAQVAAELARDLLVPTTDP